MIGHQNGNGLSSVNKNLIVGLLFFVLLVWGPIEPYGLAVRLGYLILLPIFAWFLLGYIGRFLNLGKSMNARIKTVIIAMVAAFLFFGAYQSFVAEQHTECTATVQTRDGTECVGDYVTVRGSDLSSAFFLSLLGIGAVWYAVADHKKQD